MGIEIVDESKVTEEEWKTYVRNHPYSTLYHLPEWKAVLQRTFKYDTFYVFARNAYGEICGLLPLIQVKSRITGNRLVSLPFSYACGPLVDSENALVGLVEYAKELRRELGCRYVEVRTWSSRSNYCLDEEETGSEVFRDLGFQAYDGCSTYILRLEKDPVQVWKKLHQKSVRWAVNKARKDGLIVRDGACERDMKQFFRLNMATKKRLGVPGHPLALFLNQFKFFGSGAKLYVAEHKGKVVAGIITLSFRDVVLYAYGASDDKYHAHRPNNIAIWTAIEEACRNGSRYFDFGRARKNDEGLIGFKRRWGTVEKKLVYYYYPRVPRTLAINDDDFKLQLARRMWKRMPLPVVSLGSSILFRHFD